MTIRIPPGRLTAAEADPLPNRDADRSRGARLSLRRRTGEGRRAARCEQGTHPRLQSVRGEEAGRGAGKQLHLHRREPRLPHPVEEVLPVHPGVAVGVEPVLAELRVRAAVRAGGAGGAGAAVGVDHREPVAPEAARDLGERPAILAHVGQGVVAEDEVEARVREREPRRARRREPAGGAEAPVMAPPPHVHRHAPRRCKRLAPHDVVGAEARRTDLQHPVSGVEPRADPLAHQPMERPRARLGSAVGAAPDARGHAVGLEPRPPAASRSRRPLQRRRRGRPGPVRGRGERGGGSGNANTASLVTAGTAGARRSTGPGAGAERGRASRAEPESGQPRLEPGRSVARMQQIASPCRKIVACRCGSVRPLPNSRLLLDVTGGFAKVTPVSAGKVFSRLKAINLGVSNQWKEN